MRTLIVAALWLAAGTAEAARIHLYWEANFKGKEVTFDRAVSDLEAKKLAGVISSLKVEEGRWEICRKADFRKCREVEGDMRDLDDIGWNNAIRSLRPIDEAGDHASGSSDSDARPHNRSRAIALRLYPALLGRKADPDGLAGATKRLAAGELEEQVTRMVGSREFKVHAGDMSDAILLDQIMTGLLDRRPVAKERNRYLEQLERGDVERVVLEIVETAEFERLLEQDMS